MVKDPHQLMSDRNIDQLKIFKGNAKKKQAADLVRRLKFAQRSSDFLFRGLHNIEYTLIPSVGRPRANGRLFSPKDEKIIFNSLRTEGMMYQKRGDLADIDLLALAQHFGAPTRLLDWTTNPLVALYFSAFEGGRINTEVDGIVYVYKAQGTDFIRKRKNYEFNLNDDDDPLFPDHLFAENRDSDVRFIFPRFVDDRIKSQSGVFSVQKTPTIPFNEECKRENLSYLVVSRDVKETLVRYLYGIGMTNELIMPGLAGFCSSLSYRYKYNVGIRSRSLYSSEVEEVEDAD